MDLLFGAEVDGRPLIRKRLSVCVTDLTGVGTLRLVLPVILVVGFPKSRLAAMVAQVFWIGMDRGNPVPVRFCHLIVLPT
jgi:hypothetical protein